MTVKGSWIRKPAISRTLHDLRDELWRTKDLARKEEIKSIIKDLEEKEAKKGIK